MMVTQAIRTTIHVGLDVAKLTLQVDLAGRELALPNTPAGHRSLLTHLHRLQTKIGLPAHVVCEGTGGYERAVVAALQAAGVATSVHNAARVRAFARAQGRLAKTDVLDATVLSDFGAAMQPMADQPPSESEAALAALVIRRDQLKELVALEARRDEHHHHPGVKKEAVLLQKQLAAHLERIETQIKELLGRSGGGENARRAADPGRRRRSGERLHALGLPARAGQALAWGHRRVGGSGSDERGQRPDPWAASHPWWPGTRTQGALHGGPLHHAAQPTHQGPSTRVCVDVANPPRWPLQPSCEKLLVHLNSILKTPLQPTA